MTLKQLKRHIARIRFNYVLLVLCCILAVASIATAIWYTGHCYDTWMNPSGSLSQEAQVASITRAINIHPGDLDGYHKILDIYLSDGTFTEEESNSYKALLNKRQERLNKSLEEAIPLYRRLALAYISSYNAPGDERLKEAYHYLAITSPYATGNAVEVTATTTYLDLEDYYSRYIWQTGSLDKPSTAKVKALLNRVSAMLDTFQQGTDRDRMAFACILADLLTRHRELWVELVGQDEVTALESDLRQQLTPVSDPAAARLYAELHAWATASEQEVAE